MSSAPHDPLRRPIRLLAYGGAAGLAALTLVDRGATRMFATPWIWLLAAILALPPALLFLRLAGRGPALRFPSRAWTLAAAAAAVVPLLSALVSPYHGPSLLAAGVPLAATCLFLLMHDWLATGDGHRRLRLENILAGAAAAAAVASTFLWLQDIAGLSRAELFSPLTFQLRNPHPLGHSNYTAGLMLLGLPWLARLGWRSRGPSRSAAILAGGLALLALFTSGSRGGLLGLAALGVAGVAVARPGWKRFLLVSGGAVLAAALLAVANPRIRSYLGRSDPAAEPDASTVQRTAMVEAGVLMGRDRPWLGWGPGTTPLVFPRYRHALAGGAENVLQLHNTPLQLWAETGAAGLFAALVLCGLAAMNWSRSRAAAATLAGYGALALTDYQLDVPVFAAATAVLLALLAPAAPSPAPRRAGILAALATVAAAGVILACGARDRTPLLNAEALQLARTPAGHDRAVALLNASLALNPDQEIAHFNLGWLLLVPDPARAEQHFLAAARLVPDKGGVYFGLGLARLNQGHRGGAALAFAIECVNEPRFLASPWWTVPEIAAQREAAAAVFPRLLAPSAPSPKTGGPWVEKQAALLTTLAPRLGQVSPGPETSYRRERLGYPVLMRNSDLAPPVDLYDVREDPRFPASVPFRLPGKGWMPSPRLLKLLDAPPPARQ